MNMQFYCWPRKHKESTKNLVSGENDAQTGHFFKCTEFVGLKRNTQKKSKNRQKTHTNKQKHAKGEFLQIRGLIKKNTKKTKKIPLAKGRGKRYGYKECKLCTWAGEWPHIVHTAGFFLHINEEKIKGRTQAQKLCKDPSECNFCHKKQQKYTSLQKYSSRVRKWRSPDARCV